MDSVEVPPFFLCPISLEIMKDPVTVSTGITYDRQSIEKWLFKEKNNTCPVTKQVLSEPDLTPNHTVRRLIQSWCTLNASNGIERFPTPKPPISKLKIVQLLNDSQTPQMQMKCLRTLRSIGFESETNKRAMEAAGATNFLASIVKRSISVPEEVALEEGFELNKASDEALSILYHLHLSEAGFKSLLGQNGEFIETLVCILGHANYESRTYAIFLLGSMIEVADPMQMISIRTKLFIEVVQVLQDQISPKVTKAALQLLIHLCPWGRNKIKAIEAGAVSVLINLLVDSWEKRACEMMLTVLEQLCQCAEGRAELLGHGAGLAVVSKKILRVSTVVSDRAVRILLLVSKFSATSSVVQEMLQLGVVAKLCLLIQVDCGAKTKEKAREILRSHGKAWKNPSCLPLSLLDSYPS